MTSASHGSTSDWITAIATAVTAVAAVVALLGAWLTIRQNQKTAAQDQQAARRQTTFDYLGRIEELSLNPAFATMSAFLRGGIRPPRIKPRSWAKMPQPRRIEETRLWWHELVASDEQEDRALMASICAYPNTLEALAAMYNHGLLDQAVVKAQVESQATGYLKVADWWITLLRDSSPTNFQDTLVMMADLAKRKKPGWYPEIPAEGANQAPTVRGPVAST